MLRNLEKLAPTGHAGPRGIGILFSFFLFISSCSSDSSISHILDELGDKKGAERYQAIKALSSEIPETLSVDQLLAIIEGSYYRLNLIQMLYNKLPDEISHEEFLAVVGPTSENDRYNTIKVLKNKAPKSLNADQLLTVIGSTHHRVNAIEMLQGSLPTELAYDEFFKIVEPTTGNDRYNTIKVLKNKAPKSLSVDQLLAIIETSHYRLNLIGMLNNHLPDKLSYEEFLKIVEPTSGNERYNMIKILASKATEMTDIQSATIVGPSTYPDRAKELILDK